MEGDGSQTMAIAAASIWTAFLGYLFIKKIRQRPQVALTDKEGRKLGRTFSFSSAAMALGCFPEHSRVPEPIINAAIFFSAKDCPDPEDVIEVVNTFLQYERCSGIPTEVRAGEWRCRECLNIDPTQLVRTVELEGNDRATYETINNHMQDPLMTGRGDLPWWEFLLVKNKGSGISACVLRMHHTIGDGLAIITLLEHFLKYTDGSRTEGLIPRSMTSKFEVQEGRLSLFLNSLKAALKVLMLSASGYDDDTMFSKSIGKGMVYSGKRKCVVFDAVPLNFIKDIKNAAQVSLNDVLFTCLSQAMHDYCLEHNCPVMKSKGEKVQCRALLSIAFPRPRDETDDKTRTMRNKWCFVSADLGLGVKNVSDRLEFVHDHLKGIKFSPIAYVQFKIQETIPPMLPLKTCQQTVFDTFSRHSLVFSNVPGPFRTCTFAKKTAIGAQMFFNDLIPQVGFVSYAGKVFGNITLDPEAIPNSDSLTVLYSRALVDLANELQVDVPQSVVKNAGPDR